MYRLALAAVLVLAAGLLAPPAHADNPFPLRDPGEPQFVSVEGAAPLSTDKTISYWQSTYTDPTNGVTYRYSMIGADPARNADTTIPVDLVPLDYVFAADGDYALRGSDIVSKVLASPIFIASDFTSTPTLSIPTDDGLHGQRVPGGELSAGNGHVQFEDAVMRAQFGKTATSYHVRLGRPTVWPAQTIHVPNGYGAVYQNSRGIVYGIANTQLSFLGSLHLDPTHLWIFVSNNVLIGHPNHWCCALGFHTAGRVLGRGSGDTGGQGDQSVATWMFTAWVQPGLYNPAGRSEFVSDVSVFSHEIAEWGDDPFANNYIHNWWSPLPPQNGCLDILENGDPLDDVGFTVPGNPDTTAYTDGNWHMQDIAFLPWFARQAPNTTSQPTQSPSSEGGRYTLLGSLNPYPAFHRPPATC
jgi:hypothetical protein